MKEFILGVLVAGVIVGSMWYASSRSMWQTVDEVVSTPVQMSLKAQAK